MLKISGLNHLDTGAAKIGFERQLRWQRIERDEFTVNFQHGFKLSWMLIGIFLGKMQMFKCIVSRPRRYLDNIG